MIRRLGRKPQSDEQRHDAQVGHYPSGIELMPQLGQKT
jgi:hypothetical protein